jgi:hypothetical protein
LMAIFDPIVHAGSSLDEHVFDICQHPGCGTSRPDNCAAGR